MTEPRIENARIDSTMLGIEGHGTLTFVLFLDFGGSQQGFGTYGLDGPYDRETKKRAPNVVAGYSIRRILEIVGVEKWEDLKGKYLRARITSGLIDAIGPILGDPEYRENFWFVPRDEFKQFAKDGGA